MRVRFVAAALVPLAFAACGNDGRDGADVPADAGGEGSGDLVGDAGTADVELDASDVVTRDVETDADAGADTAVEPGAPPVCVASCVERGRNHPPATELSVIPLDVIDCTADGSFDPGGGEVRFAWSVVDRPEGSTSMPRLEEAPGTMSFFVDLAGRYELELDAVDADGRRCEEPATVVLTSGCCEDLHVQLVWHTPSDPDESDSDGTDLDLHLLHSNGCWGDPIWDLGAGNLEPDWGTPGRTDDDPSLDVDDTDGAGPENANLHNPEYDTTYRIGVAYRGEHGFGASTAIVRVYLFGVLVYEGERVLEAVGDFWEVASIDWPTGAVTVIDRVSQGAPSCE